MHYYLIHVVETYHCFTSVLFLFCFNLLSLLLFYFVLTCNMLAITTHDDRFKGNCTDHFSCSPIKLFHVWSNMHACHFDLTWLHNFLFVGVSSVGRSERAHPPLWLRF